MATLVIRTKGLPAETLELKPGVNRLGRSSDNDFKIQHDTISRFHCEVVVQEDALWAHDLDSSNGTYVNDLLIEGRVYLTDGDLLRLGDVNMEVQDAPGKPADEDASPKCANHPDIIATMICSQCQLTFCGACVHVLSRVGGKILRVCPSCSGHCESLEGMNQGRRPKGLLGHITSLFKTKPIDRPFHD